jgi:hypothetical protein
MLDCARWWLYRWSSNHGFNLEEATFAPAPKDQMFPNISRDKHKRRISVRHRIFLQIFGLGHIGHQTNDS